MALPTDSHIASSDKGRRKLIIGVIIGALVVHLVVGIVAGIWIVARYFAPPPATFEVKKDLRLPAKEREHKMNMSEFDALTPKPSFNDTLASLRPTDFALPDLPKIPTDQMLPLDPSEIVSDQVSSMVGASGTGGGGDGGGGDGGLGGGFSFLGIESNARRILILYDVSNTSIRKAREAGVPFTMIRDETKELVNKLSISSRFGLMMFARNYVFFNKELVPASDDNKVAAGVWMDKYFTEDSPMSQSVPDMVRGSPGFLVLLEAAFSKDPDAIFIVSDGGFYQGSGGTNEKIEYRDIDKLIDSLQKARDKPVAVHFIAANMDRDDESGMKRIIRGSGGGGRFKELGK